MTAAGPTMLIRNGRVIDPAQGLDAVRDLRIEGGRIAAGEARAGGGADVEIDAHGLIVAPGLIDMHVHFREPGAVEKETIASGSAAAVAGGFTSVACMPNTDPPLDNEAAIEFVCRQASRAGLCNVYPVGAITKGRAGKELAEMGMMVRAGAVAFSDDGGAVASSAVMMRAMQYVKMFNKPLIQHCEDAELSGGAMNAGYTSVRLGIPGVPAIAEDLIVQRDITLAAATGARYHVAHISTKGAVELVRQGKARGVSVTAEVCPHHLLMTEEMVETYDTNYKMNPPLRGRDDVAACLGGVRDGTIDCLITDHAPHTAAEKELEFVRAPFGIIGLETALAMFIRALIPGGVIDWPSLIRAMTFHPARVLNLDKGTLLAGRDADVTLIDPQREWTIDVEQFHSQSRNCPWHGQAVVGKALVTIVGGEIKYTDEQAAGRIMQSATA